MVNNVFISDYNTISPLGLDKNEVKTNLLTGKLCISELTEENYKKLVPIKYLGLIPGQLLTSQYEVQSAELIAQKKKWIESLFKNLNAHQDIDTILFIHNCGPNVGAYYYLKDFHKSILYDKTEFSIMQPLDFISQLESKNSLSKDVQMIHFHNTCSSVPAALTYAAKRMKLNLSRKTLIIAFENSNNNWLTLLSLYNLGVVNQKAQQISEAIVPFSSNRAGFVKADALGYLMLEAGNNNAIAEIVSGKYSCDSHSLTDGVEDGSMVESTMRDCLRKAKVNPQEIDYINAHGSGTYLNDIIEVRGIKRLFGENAGKILISSTKSQFGHALCSTGMVEISAVCSMFEESFVGANINCDFADKECDLNFVKKPIAGKKLKYVLKNSFGFGGYNSTILLRNLKA